MSQSDAKSRAECCKYGETRLQLGDFRTLPDNQEWRRAPALHWAFQKNRKTTSSHLDSGFSVYKMFRFFNYWYWLSLAHFLLVNMSMSLFGSFCLCVVGDWQQACQKKKEKKKSSTGLRSDQSEHAKIAASWPSLTPAFPRLLCMYVLVRTGCFHIWSLSCVFLWAHSHARRILFPSLFLQTPLLLPKPRFPVRSRQKLGLACLAARELASNLLFLWGLVWVCRLKQSQSLMEGILTSSLMIEWNKL